jgi:hypothetical protein
MQKSIHAILCLAFLAVAPAAADDAADARAIIDRGIEAAGGKDKLAKFNAQTWKEKGTYHGAGQPQPYTGVYAAQWPDRFRMEIENVFTLIVNGDQGWIKTGNQTTELTKDQVASQKGRLYGGWVSSLLPLADKEFKLLPLPELEINKRPAEGVRVSRQGSPTVDLYFDKGTGLLARTEQRVQSDEENKEVKQEASYSEYREIEGAKIPMKLAIKRDGKAYLEADHHDLKPAPKLDEKVFAKPE